MKNKLRNTFDFNNNVYVIFLLSMFLVVVWLFFTHTMNSQMMALQSEMANNGIKMELLMDILKQREDEALAVRVAEILRDKMPDVPSPDIVSMSVSIVDVSKRYPVILSPSVILALIEQESGFDPDAVSSVGAIGLMQVMPDTGLPILKALGYQEDVDLLFNPKINVQVGLEHLQTLCYVYKGDQKAVIEAYFWGSRNYNRLVVDNPQKLADVGYARSVLAKSRIGGLL